MVAGLTNLELVESVMGAFYCFSLVFNTEAWLSQNLKGKTTAKVEYITKLCGILCFGLRLSVHHARTNGGAGGAGLCFGLAFNYWIAAVWGACAWLNRKNAGLLTKDGEMNIYICGGIAALFAATAAGIDLGPLN